VNGRKTRELREQRRRQNCEQGLHYVKKPLNGSTEVVCAGCGKTLDLVEERR
jgi:hypothetical protein